LKKFEEIVEVRKMRKAWRKTEDAAGPEDERRKKGTDRDSNQENFITRKVT